MRADISVLGAWGDAPWTEPRPNAAALKRERLSRRQQAFRADFRAKIGRLYHGWAHVALIYAIGGAAIWYCARQLRAPAWYEWLVVPAAFLGANVFEWWIHKYVMHRPLKGLMGIYKRHTLAHHQFFTENEPTIDNARDFRIVFFPPYALITFLAMSLVPACCCGWLRRCRLAAADAPTRRST